MAGNKAPQHFHSRDARLTASKGLGQKVGTGIGAVAILFELVIPCVIPLPISTTVLLSSLISPHSIFPRSNEMSPRYLPP